MHSKLTVHRYIRMETGILSVQPSQSLWKTLSSSSTLQSTSESDSGLSLCIQLHSWKQFTAANSVARCRAAAVKCIICKTLIFDLMSFPEPMKRAAFSTGCSPQLLETLWYPPSWDCTNLCSLVENTQHRWQWCSWCMVNKIVRNPQNLSILLTDWCKQFKNSEKTATVICNFLLAVHFTRFLTLLKPQSLSDFSNHEQHK